MLEEIFTLRYFLVETSVITSCAIDLCGDYFFLKTELCVKLLWLTVRRWDATWLEDLKTARVTRSTWRVSCRSILGFFKWNPLRSFKRHQDSFVNDVFLGKELAYPPFPKGVTVELKLFSLGSHQSLSWFLSFLLLSRLKCRSIGFVTELLCK